MGVIGLTSFIARHASFYLQPYELHDCDLVIDGDNLACNLFKDVAGRNSAFGGDYDAFYRTVVEFFHVLNECNVRAYVLMDGGYEKKKLRTVWQRLRGKVAIIKRIDPVNSRRIFPLMMREVFVDALNDCGVPVMRCIFEADDELAALSRKLNCPVLSYDSDFYIYNVKYIPLVTLTVKALKTNAKKSAANKALRKCLARHLEKRTTAHKIIKGIEVDAEDRKAPKTGKMYKYLDCCIFKFENLIKEKVLDREKLPLFAALLGNDYIARSAFSSFFAQMGQKGMSKKSTRTNKRIQKVLEWLKHETLDSALDKIVGRLKTQERSRLLAQMKGAVERYSAERCLSYEFFSSHYEDAFTQRVDSIHTESDGEECADKEAEDRTEDENKQLEEETPNNEETPVVVGTEIIESEDSEEEDDDDDGTEPLDLLPEWFKDRIFSTDLPRFFVDLVHLRIYINNPQVEHFPFNDCNEIGLPILSYIFSLLHHVGGSDENKIFPVENVNSSEDSEESVPYMRYVSRLTRVSNIHTVRYPLGPPPGIEFDPAKADRRHFEAVFRNLKVDCKKLFTEIDRIPSDLRLYFLSLIYWIQNTDHADVLHLHSLLICLVLLRTVDSNVEPIREERAFQQRFGKIIEKEKLARANKQEPIIVKEVNPELSPTDRIKFIPKIECLLVQENLLKHFHMQEIFKKKYDYFASTVLHGFAEFQSVVFNLHGLNGLLGNVFQKPRMAQCYCGVFLYNIYGLLRSRIDLKYYIQHHIFQSSPLMFDFYEFLWNWCEEFVPLSQKNKTGPLMMSKNVLKRRKAAAKKKAAAAVKNTQSVDPYDEDVDRESTKENDEFYDLNNKFCELMKAN